MKGPTLRKTLCLAALMLLAYATPGNAQQAPAPQSAAGQSQDHAGHASAGNQPETSPAPAAQETKAPAEPIPVLTDEDRKAAFPELAGHHVHDRKLNYFVLVDQAEWGVNRRREFSGTWDTKGWIGGDVNRLWFRTEGQIESGRLGEGEAHFMYGRSFSRWWDFVAGVRQDVRPGPAQTWAAAGIQGLAPYWSELEATLYVGSAGRVQARIEAEYDLLITNRLILQPHGQIDLFSKPFRQVGSGLSSAEGGLRLRYEMRREFAPYVGFAWTNSFGGTADFARAAGVEIRSAQFVAGVRMWF